MVTEGDLITLGFEKKNPELWFKDGVYIFMTEPQVAMKSGVRTYIKTLGQIRTLLSQQGRKRCNC